MKKIYSVMVMSILALTMMFSLTACGGPSEEQAKKMEDLMVKYETVVADCSTEFAKFPQVDDEDYNKNLKTSKETLDTIKEQVVEMRKAYEDNKNSYTPEKADEVIASLEEQVKKGETFLQSIKDGVKQINNLLAQQNEG